MVNATSVDLEVAMPRGLPFPRSMRRELFDLVCAGTSVREAERLVGVSVITGSVRWREAGGMQLLRGKEAHGLADPGNPSLPGRRGNRLNDVERVEIMRLRDAA